MKNAAMPDETVNVIGRNARSFVMASQRNPVVIAQ